MSSPIRAIFGFVLTSGLLLAPANARAFCQATTCDPTDVQQHCQYDASRCLLSGKPLHWASDCLTISVQADGAPKAGIDYDAAEASVRRAFAAWTSVDCDGAKPSLRVEVSGAVSCNASEYSTDRRNANIVMFRENDWPYVGAEDALGLTRVRFDIEDVTGELWDADIEVNAVSEPLSAGQPKSNEVDLDSLLTHEAGHVLGLGHTLTSGATMLAGYKSGSDALRTLEPDDVAGICSLYPPQRRASSSSCEPRHGFSERCGDDQPTEEQPMTEEPEDEAPGGSNSCSFARSAPHAASSLLALVGVLAFVRRRRASSPKRHQVVPCGWPDLRR